MFIELLWERVRICVGCLHVQTCTVLCILLPCPQNGTTLIIVAGWVWKMAARMSQEVQEVSTHTASLEWVQDRLWHVCHDSTDALLTQMDIIRITIDHGQWIDALMALVSACQMLVVYIVARIFQFGSMALISGCTVIWCTTSNMARVGTT